MSNFLPNGGFQRQRGVKRTYHDQGDTSYMYAAVGNAPGHFYHSNWIPPGNHMRRLPSHDNYYDIPNKMLRTENLRSYSTSSVPSSSMPVLPYSQPPHSHTFMSKTAVNGRRTMSPSVAAVATVPLKVTIDNDVKSDSRRSTSTHRNKCIGGDDDKGGKSKRERDSSSQKRKVSSSASTSETEDNPRRDSEREAGPSSSKKNNSDMAKSQEMSRRIWRYYVANKQTKVEENVKEEMRIRLQECIRDLYPTALLLLGGSSLNGFGSKGCDADMCLYLSESQINQKEARHILITLKGYLQHRCSFIKNMKVIFAKVPILKFQHKRFRDLDCDLNINHHTGVRNTALLQTYSKLDWRVAPLVMLIKQWAKNHGINDASQGTLSSYSYVLMIINYLQVGCKPPVVKSVQAQEWGRSEFSDRRSILHSWNKLYSQSPSYLDDGMNQSKNSDDLFSLLKGFFAYYANFDFENTVISIRLGSCFPCTLLPPNDQGWRQKYIFIEEPFDRINTARSVFDWSRYRQILDAFEETHRSLCKTSDLDVESFLNYR